MLWYGIFSVGGMQLLVFWLAPASSTTMTQKVLDILRPSEAQFIYK